MIHQPSPDEFDDALGRALRDEIPEPGPGYWHDIDMRLRGASVTAQETGVADPQIDQQHVDTGSELIRLKDMTSNNPNPPNRPEPPRRLLLALAAGAALIAGVVGFAVLRDSTSSAETVVLADAPDGVPEAGIDAASSADVDTDPTTEPRSDEPPESAGTGAANDPSLDPSVGVAADAPKQQRCFFEQYLPDEDPDPTVVWVVEIEGSSFRSLIQSQVAGGTADNGVEAGTIGPDGVGRTDAGARIDFDERSASRTEGGIEPFTAVEVECTQVENVAELFARLDVGAAALPETTTAPPTTVAATTPDADADTATSTTVPEDDDASPSTTSEPVPVDPVDDLEFAQSLVGLTLEAAQAATEASGRPFRIIGIDGEDLAVTQDFIENRINVVLEGGIVTATSLG